MEVYAWGSGNYGRLGLGHSRDALIPQRVSGVLNGCDVTSTACGWYHSAVVTSTGDVATFGSRVTKNLGITDSGSEASDATGSDASEMLDSLGEEEEEDEEEDVGHKAGAHRGRGSSYSANSRKRRPRRASVGAGDRHCTADFVPHVLRSFPSRVTVVQVAIGSDMLGAHTLALARNGRLYSWGYGPACGLGSTPNVGTPTLVTKFLGSGTGEIASGRLGSNEMEPLGWGRPGHQRYRQRVSNRRMGWQVMRPRISKVACGGGFSVVLSTEGEVFTFGLTAGGRLGFRTKFRAQLRPRRIEMLSEGTTDLSAGAGFVILCSAAGRLLAWGDNSKGQLGIGHLQESHEPVALGRVCPATFVMQAVAAGDSHCLALDSSGRTYSWGGEGGPMTGQGQVLSNPLQVDATFQFRLRMVPYWWVRPSPIRGLIGTRVVFIAAGCLHSIALSQDGALFSWGAALQAGASATATPAVADRLEVSWVPRLVAPSPKLPLVRIGTVSAGGWHSLATAMPSCPIERLAPTSGESADSIRHFCDGFLVSDADSDDSEEARVLLCCAAVRARLALPDGSDSPIWAAFLAQVHRLSPDFVGGSSRGEPTEPDQGSSDEGSLMDIVTLHRDRPKPASGTARGERAQAGAKATTPRHTSDADEAAGKARPIEPDRTTAVKQGMDTILEPSKLDAQAFSSDSNGSDSEGQARPAPRRSRRQESRPRPRLEFSSDSSGSDHEPPPVQRAAASVQASPSHPPARGLGLELSTFSEAVLTALVRFLHTDMLGCLEVIDEAHPGWQREQHLKMRPLGHGPGEVGDATRERPSLHRATKGLLLRREVNDLRCIGNNLGLERLVRLCDQLLHRIDAPGAPALFVPASTFGNAMWTLLQQTQSGPSSNGSDTQVLCGPSLPRRRAWGLQKPRLGGRHWAHAFVLCAGCDNIRLDSNLDAGDGPLGDWQRTCSLRRCDATEGHVRYELDLSDVAADVVHAWLRYLYTQDDLSLTWPCSAEPLEDAVAAERFWVELVRLACRLGDEKLRLYAQDTLVGALAADNWAELAMFAEQAQCRLLSEAALMMGVRLLQPALLSSFRVPTGLEKGAGQRDDAASQGGGIPEHTATVGGSSSSSLGGAARGAIELELERHLLELRASSQGTEHASILALKKGNPAQFAELKQRLAESITTAQRVGLQLQHCARFFDTHEKRGFKSDDGMTRARWAELVVLSALLVFFVVPTTLRQTVIMFLVSVFEPLRVGASFIDWSWLPPIAAGTLRVVAVNVFMFFVLCLVLWSGLKG